MPLAATGPQDKEEGVFAAGVAMSREFRYRSVFLGPVIEKGWKESSAVENVGEEHTHSV